MAGPFCKDHGGKDKDKEARKPRGFLKYALTFKPTNFLHGKPLLGGGGLGHFKGCSNLANAAVVAFLTGSPTKMVKTQ
jgi:hypothetical protein